MLPGNRNDNNDSKNGDNNINARGKIEFRMVAADGRKHGQTTAARARYVNFFFIPKGLANVLSGPDVVSGRTVKRDGVAKEFRHRKKISRDVVPLSS